MNEVLGRMRELWQRSSTRPVDELWSAILQMTDDPVMVADLIAEAGQRDESVMPSADAMSEINDVATQED
jgi:hypothetical protein